MCTIDNVAAVLVLILLSWCDLKKRKVPTMVLIVSGIAVIVYKIANGDVNIGQFIGDIGPGVVFLLISKVTEEGVGYGDSLGILILGGYAGFWQMMQVLLCTFFLLLCILIPVLYKKKMSRKTGVAFYPFLTCGYICSLIIGG